MSPAALGLWALGLEARWLLFLGLLRAHVVQFLGLLELNSCSGGLGISSLWGSSSLTSLLSLRVSTQRASCVSHLHLYQSLLWYNESE